tara:strand:- start:2358 stop:2462 length:105 start_codon:yes stop_codon:yes gene_type:complete
MSVFDKHQEALREEKETPSIASLAAELAKEEEVM